MMKKFSRILTFGLAGCFLLNSCSNDDDVTDDITPEPEGAYQDGFFILNEGAAGAGTVSFVTDDFSENMPEIYQEENDGEDLGQFTQSMFFDDEFAYIISNGSNMISIVDRYTFELVDRIESGLQSPRYAVIENEKIYVTNQASYEDPGVTEFDDFLAIIDLETLEVEKTIETNTRLEYIQEEDGLIYLQNAAFGKGSGITVIDATSDEIINTLETEEELNSFKIEDGLLYALSASALEKIDLDSGEVFTEIEIEGAANLELEDDMIYYTLGNSVYVMDKNAEEAPEEALFSYSSDSAYGAMYAFEVEDDRIFIGDAGDFTANGFIQVYDASGQLLEEIEAGVGPNSVYFQ